MQETFVTEKISVNRISISLLSIITISILTYLGASLKIYLPFTPVPVTFQTYFVLTAAALTQYYISMSGQILYIIAALIGIPVFANGLTGIPALLHPTSGYILGFIIASFVVGKLLQKSNYSIYKLFIAMILGNCIIYLFGVFRLALICGIKNSILLGVIPFIYGDILKIILATLTVKTLRGKIK